LVAPIEDRAVSHREQRDAISAAAVYLAKQLKVPAIIAETKSGATAANIASHRPNLPIISVTSEPRSAQQLALSYANRCYVRPDAPEAGFDLASELKAEGYFGNDPTSVIIVSGQQPGIIGTTDTIKVRILE
jgi:pyruvate kinase